MQWEPKKITGFEWNSGNEQKSLDKHAVTCSEAEQVFLNAPLKVIFDALHSKSEPRFHAFGQTDVGRLLTVTFTVRAHLVRVISARPMSRKERKFYEKN
jgi:uncharacterized protein